MYLEQAIQENTAAIRDLIAAIRNGIPTSTEQVAVVVQEAQVEEKPAKTEKKGKAEKAETPKDEPAVTPEPKADAAPAADDVPEVTYQDAAAAITQLSKVKGRDAAVALLKKYGASKLPEVKPEDFAAIVADANRHAQAGV